MFVPVIADFCGCDASPAQVRRMRVKQRTQDMLVIEEGAGTAIFWIDLPGAGAIPSLSDGPTKNGCCVVGRCSRSSGSSYYC